MGVSRREYIKIQGVYFKVVGLHHPKASSDMGESKDASIFIPFSTFQKAFNTGNEMGWMAILVKPDEQVAVAENKTKALLKRRYNIHPEDPRAIGSFDFSQIFTGINAFTLALQGFSFFVGIFTLLAGVIAVSNILLITVKERTKEIGVRRALGATPKIIKRQILLESLVLTVFAGIIGFTLSVLILQFLDAQFGSGDFPFRNPTVSFIQVGISFGLMVSLSILIGLIPANRAVKIRPIEALREE